MFQTFQRLTNPPSDEDQERMALLDEALSWLRTPYRQQTDIKGVGADCVMFMVRCFVDSGLVPPFDPRPYPNEWHLHQSEEIYTSWLGKYTVETHTPKPGDVVMLKYGRCYSHSALILNEFQLIHAHKQDGMVSLADVHLVEFKDRPFKVYSYWGAK
jgi:cell wall-associated NlpC family hydrolase